MHAIAITPHGTEHAEVLDAEFLSLSETMRDMSRERLINLSLGIAHAEGVFGGTFLVLEQVALVRVGGTYYLAINTNVRDAQEPETPVVLPFESVESDMLASVEVDDPPTE